MPELDAQREAIYRAEDTVPQGRAFATLDDCRRYVDEIINNPAFRARWRPRRVRVQRGHTRLALSGGGVINLAEWAQNERSILHELAHQVTSSADGYHGATFVQTYLDLVRLFMGLEVTEQLRAAFAVHGVDMRAPGTPAPAPGDRLATLARQVDELRRQQRELREQIVRERRRSENRSGA